MNTSGAGSPLPRPVIYLARNRLSRGERQRTGGTFSADMAALGLEPRVEVEVGPGKADAAVALDLGLAEGAQVLVRRRRMYGDDFPMRLATSYFPADLVRGSVIEQPDTGHGGVYARLEEMGHQLVGPYVERVSTRALTGDEAAWFGLAAGVPLLVVTRVARTADRTVEVNRILLPGDCHELVYEIDAT